MSASNFSPEVRFKRGSIVDVGAVFVLEVP